MSKDKETDKNKEKETERPDKWSLIIAGSYALIMLGIGLPLWWKTTTVYRVSLPYDEMLSMDRYLGDNFKISLRAQLKGFNTSTTDGSDIDSVIEGLDHSFHLHDSPILNGAEIDAIYKSSTLEELDKSLCQMEMSRKSQFDFTIYYVGREDLYKEYGRQMIVGNCKNIYYVSNSSKLKSLEPILNFLRQFINYEKTGDDMMVLLPLSSGYDLIFSLIVPEPEVLHATWNIKENLAKFIDPMLHKLGPIAEFTTRSQYLYYTKLNVNPSKELSPSGFYEIPYSQLPLVINPVESKLSSYVSQNPVLNFLVYVMPCSSVPAQLLDEHNDVLESNAFFVPQWGGIQIYNGPCGSPNPASSDGIRHQIEMEKVIGIFISQFRDLIGTPQLEPETILIKQSGSVFRDWEVEMMLRRRLHRLLFTSCNTLKSLGSLLDHITNIVVREEVGNHVQLSVESLKRAFDEAKAGNIHLAQEYAIIAFKSSEAAFHHPSNLAQLYFPDDQKYAIYIPLFLPVGIPVLLSLKNIIRYFKGT